METEYGKRNRYPREGAYRASLVLSEEFERLSCNTNIVDRILFVEREGKRFCLLDTETSFTSRIVSRIMSRKHVAASIFRDAGISVADGRVFQKSEKEKARAWLKKLGRGVVKPADGSRGRGVSVNVDAASFGAAWKAAVAVSRSQVLVETFFAVGQEARYLVVDGKCVAVHLRLPPAVTGDGKHSIQQLIDARNVERKLNPSRSRCLIEMDAQRITNLERQGLTLASVLPPGQRIVIDRKAGLSTGGDAAEITATASPDLKRIAERAVAAIPSSGADVIGVDILAKDHYKSPSPDDYIIIEANTAPMISGHQFPDFGPPVNVARMIAESCLAKMGFADSCLADKRLPAGKSLPDGKAILVFAGDTSLGDAYATKSKKNGHGERLEKDPLSFFAEIMPLVSDKDFFLINLETVLAQGPAEAYFPGKLFTSWDDPERTVPVLKLIGTDAVSLANNHSLDLGPERFLGSIHALEDEYIEVLGAGRNLSIAAKSYQLNTNAGKVHILAAFEVRGRYHRDYDYYAGEEQLGVNLLPLKGSSRFILEIKRIRSEDPDAVIVVYPHWGGSQNYKWSTPRMRSTNDALLGAGADLVLGHGAHMLQECVAHPIGTTIYSLGNFIYNSPGRYKAKKAPAYGLVCRLELERKKGRLSGELKLYPIVTDNRATGYRTRPVSEAEANDVFMILQERMDALSRRSFSLEQDERGWYLTRVTGLSSRVAASSNAEAWSFSG